jgi:hypothetical protein
VIATWILMIPAFLVAADLREWIINGKNATLWHHLKQRALAKSWDYRLRRYHVINIPKKLYQPSSISRFFHKDDGHTIVWNIDKFQEDWAVWLRDNCQGKFGFAPGVKPRLWFARYDDALHFRMRWI